MRNPPLAKEEIRRKAQSAISHISTIISGFTGANGNLKSDPSWGRFKTTDHLEPRKLIVPGNTPARRFEFEWIPKELSLRVTRVNQANVPVELNLGDVNDGHLVSGSQCDDRVATYDLTSKVA